MGEGDVRHYVFAERKLSNNLINIEDSTSVTAVQVKYVNYFLSSHVNITTNPIGLTHCVICYLDKI